MADKKVRIVVTGKDDASKAMKSVNQSLLSVVKGAALVAVAFTAMKKATAVVTELVAESTKLAARNQMMATSLKVVGSNAGWTGGQLERAVAAVKEMGITTGVATTTVTRYIQSQLDAGKTTGEATARMVELASAARDLAVVAGTNTSEALQTMQRAISGVLPRSLRVFGITENLNSVFTRYAETLGIAAEELTELQRKQAVEWRILEEGVIVAGAYEEAMGSVGKQQASLARHTEEAQAALGEAFLPAMSLGVTIATEFWAAIGEVAPQISEQLAPALESLGATVMPLVLDAIGTMIEQLPILAGHISDLTLMITDTIDALLDMRLETADTSETFEEYEKRIIEAHRGHGLLAISMTTTQLRDELLRSGILMTEDAFYANAAAVVANASELERLSNMTSIVGSGLQDLALDAGVATDAMGAYTDQVWAALVAEDAFFGGWGSEHVAPGIDWDAVGEAAEEAQDKEAKAAREAARAATDAYNEEIRKIRVEEALAGLPGAFAESIDRMREALSGLEDFELIDATELGEKLENMIWAMSETVQALIPMLQNLAEMYGGEVLVESADLAGNITDVLGVLSSIGKLADVREAKFLKVKRFTDLITNYVWGLRIASRKIMDWIRLIKPEWREMLADSTDVAKNIKDLFTILGPDLSKITPVTDAAKFEANTALYFDQMRAVGKKIMQWIGDIKPAWRKALAAAAPVAGDIKSLFDILSIDLTKLDEEAKTGFLDRFTTFLLNIEAATDVAVEILNRIKAKWGDQLATAAETMGHAAAIWQGVADMTKAIDDAAELGGPDIAAANAMAGMTNDILFGRPGQQGGAAGRLPGMGGDTVVNLQIIAEIDGVGTFTSGEISESVAANEEQLISMRISMASASV